MDKLTFTLKQHTPLIHFQPDQHGATLRASEVKPRLDRFILEELGDNSYLKGVELARVKGWILKKNDHSSLDYKLKIVGNEHTGRSEEPPSPIYFGNINMEEEKKKKLSMYKTVTFHFTSENAVLKDLKFEEYLAEFLCRNNFGSRCRKGFGSFTLIQNNVTKTVDDKKINFANFYKYQFTVSNTNYKEVFFHINLLSKLIRSGYNINGLYVKALSFSYARSKEWQWDKRSIKDQFPEIIRFSSTSSNTFDFQSNILFKGNKPFVRGILGLSTNQNWNEKILHIVDEEQKYERYASPILYKPVLNDNNTTTIYFDWVDKKNGIWGKTFNHHVNDNINNNLSLTVPQKHDFEPDKFMLFISKAQPRKYLDFRLDLRLIKKKLSPRDFKEPLDSLDKTIVLNWIKSKVGNYFVIQNLPTYKIGLDDFSLFDFFKDLEFSSANFVNKEAVKAFIDSFIPKRELKAIDTIFNQLNTLM